MTGTKRDNYYAILMAGGVGSRFWPASKKSSPKQFLDILAVGETLFQTTFKRLSRLIPQENIYVLTNEDYVDVIKEQISSIHDDQIVGEPAMRNTAPSILLGSMKIYDKNPDASIVVAPCDHWIKEEEDFITTLEKAFLEVENNDKLITLGIQPNSPNTGYGYIEYYKDGTAEVKPVIKFTEKPGENKAQEFLDAGNYAWNAGIFIWRAETIIANFKSHLREMYDLFAKAEKLLNTTEEKKFIKENYHLAANISIDYGIMEKSDKVYMIPASFDWNDLGTWSSVQSELPADEDGNTIMKARVLSKDSSNNIISTSGNKLVVIQGLDDYIIVEDKDVLMIVPKSNEQGIKEWRKTVMDKFGEELG